MKTDLPDEWLLRVCQLLNKQGAHYIIVGAWACVLHGYLRATQDIDMLIPKKVSNTEAVLKALEHLTFGMARELDAEHVTQKPFTIIGDIPRVDLLTVAGRMTYERAIKKAKRIRVRGVRVVFADVDTLIESKKTGRLQDAADIERLQQIIAKKKKLNA